MILLLAKLCVFAKSKFFVPMLIQVCKSFRIRDSEGKSGLIQKKKYYYFRGGAFDVAGIFCVVFTLKMSDFLRR